MDTLEITIPVTEAESDILIGQLAGLGFEGFEISDQEIKAYISPDNFNEAALQSTLTTDYTVRILKDQNWNETWEKNFEPTVVDDKCRLRADFHDKGAYPIEIIITPKMAFGTGHHPTTKAMMSWLLNNPIKGKEVIDAGCGSGVLAILAEIRGANTITAYDNDNWAYYNTLENIRLNNASRISVFQGEANHAGIKEGSADIVLANINKNILIQELPYYSKWLKPGGYLVMSGFYSMDSSEIAKEGAKFYLRNILESVYQGWSLLVLSK